MDEGFCECDSFRLAFGSVSEVEAVGCDSQWGLFPWHQSLSRLGLMAEEMTA